MSVVQIIARQKNKPNVFCPKMPIFAEKHQFFSQKLPIFAKKYIMNESQLKKEVESNFDSANKRALGAIQVLRKPLRGGRGSVKCLHWLTGHN